ncbi:MAG: choice-of-anchor B family protein [Planctomycetota bacterium]|nr:choice-of-anchor B family protein [Planctomycetota bacterium]
MGSLRSRSVMGRFVVASLAAAGLGLTQAGAQFTSDNVNLLSQIPLSGFPSNPTSANDCWGYTSPSGREYALMGVRDALVVVEITTPSSPVIVGQVTHSNCLWGDVKVYGDYCYVVNECGGGIDVIDLADVDNGNVTLVGQVTKGGLATSHDIAIDTDSGFLYLCGANINGGRLVAWDLSDPANPTLAGQVPSSQGAYVHDAQIVTYTSGPYAGKQIAFCANGGIGLDIYDVTNKSNMFRLSRTTYPNLSYCHQCWLSDDRQYLYLDDETDGVNETVIFDVTDLSNPLLVNTYSSGVSATDHNLYVRDGFIYEAEYHAGLRIFCADDPVNPVQVGWFDTYPENDGSGFDGAWGVYPFFPSGTVIVSDINRGLFILDPADALSAGALTFAYPQGRPELIDPQGGTAVLVEVAASCGVTVEPNTALLHYDIGQGFVTVPMQLVSENVYDAVFPAIECGLEVSYYVSAQATSGATFTDPSGAPGETFSVLSANEILVQSQDDLEADTGWVVGAPGDDASTGIWERVDPVGTAAQPEDDHTPVPGTMCFVTGQCAPGCGLGDNDVDGGQTTLTTPTIDLSAIPDAQISYWRWYSNSTGADPNADVFVVDISNDNGSTWTNVETIGPSGPQTSGGWFFHAFNVTDFVLPTAQVRVRFIASDEGAGSLVEAAVDDFTVSEVVCEPSATADINGPRGAPDGCVDAFDLGAILGAWCSGVNDPNPPSPPCENCTPANLAVADISGAANVPDGCVDAFDLAKLLAEWCSVAGGNPCGTCF